MTAALYNSILSNLPAGEKKEELRKLCKAHPHFAAAQFTLLTETEEGSPSWKEQGQKASLLFSPFLLKQNKSAIAPSEKNDSVGEIESPVTVAPQQEDEMPVRTSLQQDDEEKIIATTIIPLNETVEENESIVVATTEIKTAEPEIQDHTSDALVFEPLHTSDYFASQGIKISYDANPTDKLGRQLKSFTGWLQTMKQVHPSKSTSSAIIMDKQVEALAEISNVEGEVVTEAMAEAYLHQGKMMKAKEIYDKLSLLNPMKSSYFAAKINALQ